MEIDKVVHRSKYQGQYNYRGTSFSRNNKTSNEYWGAYSIGYIHQFSSRQKVLEYIDNKLDN